MLPKLRTSSSEELGLNLGGICANVKVDRQDAIATAANERRECIAYMYMEMEMEMENAQQLIVNRSKTNGCATRS